MESLKKILITDLSFWGGHHETYFMEILLTLKENYIVYACCVENEKLRSNIQENNLERCHVVDLNLTILDKLILKLLKGLDRAFNIISKLKDHPIKFASLFHLIATQRLLSDLGEDIPVFFANTDSAMPAVPPQISRFFMPSRWVGLHVLPSYHSQVAFGRKKSRVRFYAEKNFALNSCRGILVLHPLYQRFFQRRMKEINCLYLPEIIGIDSRKKDSINLEIIEKIKNRSTEKTIISILGNLTRKKNIILLLKSFLYLDKTRYFLLILGGLRREQYTEQELSIIEDYQENINYQNAYIKTDYFIKNETEFNELIKLSDIVFLHYQDHPYSSHILTRSMAQRKPVIVNKGFLMEKIVNHYNWPVATNSNPREIAKAIESINYSNQIADNQYRSFIENHSCKNIRNQINKICPLLYYSDSLCYL